jgi:hypothetical protein
MTARLYETIGVKMAEAEAVEIFPRIDERAGRVPFGKHFTPVDPGREALEVEELLSVFDSLEEYEMQGRVAWTDPGQVYGLLRGPEVVGASKGWYREGEALYFNGLETMGTRHESQARVIYYLYRQNYPPEHVERLAYKWIKNKHHGKSRAMNERRYQAVRGEIHRQTKSIFRAFGESLYLPDWVHHSYNGWLTKPDLETIARVCRGSAPRIKFATQLFTYANPRQKRPWVRIHSNKLRAWGSWKTYARYLGELEDAGILRRNSSYWAADGNSEGLSKSITFTGWQWDSLENAILDDERAPETFEETIRAAFDPREYRRLIVASGASKSAATEQVKRIWTP